MRSHGKLLKLLRPGAGPAAPILPLCPGLPEKMIDVSDAIRRRRELSISRIRLDVLIWGVVILTLNRLVSGTTSGRLACRD
jgi:hypothetical protein